ncbi:MAG TPA: carboxypeptidase-like regulatory domain-containing protein [Vicinamibacterales bacterium]|nr:carboxypeptidase-like regulatory domain-containing protein [Vicinamibacterales bacterium]
MTAIAPGIYALEAALPGFAKYSRRDIRPDLGRTTTLNVQLSPGGVARRHSWLVRGSWFVVRGSWFVVRGWWLVVGGWWLVVG